MAAKKKRPHVNEAAVEEVSPSEDAALQAAMDDYDARADLIAELVRCRHERGLTQQYVAASMETTQSFVSDFENGRTDPHLSTYQRYARALGLKLTTAVTRPATSPADLFRSREEMVWGAAKEMRARAGGSSGTRLSIQSWSRQTSRSDYELGA